MGNDWNKEWRIWKGLVWCFFFVEGLRREIIGLGGGGGGVLDVLLELLVVVVVVVVVLGFGFFIDGDVMFL